MYKGFKKLLMNTLILAIIVLPFRMAFSMPVDNSKGGSGQHCKGMAMVGVPQNGQMQSLDSQSLDAPSVDVVMVNSVSQADCCSMSDNDCIGCVHITAVYYYDFLQFSEPSDTEVFSEASLSLITRVISPPSRPPLIHHV